MLIAKVQDGEIVELGSYQTLFPNTSFTDQGPDDEFLNENSCLRVNNNIEYNTGTQKLVDCAARIDGDVVRTKEAVDLTQEELDAITAALWDAVRAERNTRLRICDWTQVTDSPLSEEDLNAWRAYRQALRDITQQDINNIVWPDAPESGEQARGV